MHSVLLSSVHLRSTSLKLSHWEKDWSLVSHSVKVLMDRRISSKMFDLEMLESLSIEQAGIACDFILYFLRHST